MSSTSEDDSCNKKIEQSISTLCANQLQLTPIRTIYEFLDKELPHSLTTLETQLLAIEIERLGFGIIPDTRYYNVILTSESPVVISSNQHGDDFKPSREFQIIGAIIIIGSLISHSDEHLSPKEEAILLKLIKQNECLALAERFSLMIFLFWCMRVPQDIAEIKDKLLMASMEEKEAISQILVTITLADGHIDLKEIKQLEHTYVELGLQKGLVMHDLVRIAAVDESGPISAKDIDKLFAIPQEFVIPNPQFILDSALLKIREEETRLAMGVLEGIFNNTDNHDNEFISVQIISCSKSFNSLNSNDQSLLNHLITKEIWARSELELLCDSLNLMIDGALESINEFSFNCVNAPLIEDRGMIYVDMELAKEILNDQ